MFSSQWSSTSGYYVRHRRSTFEEPATRLSSARPVPSDCISLEGQSKDAARRGRPLFEASWSDARTHGLHMARHGDVEICTVW